MEIRHPAPVAPQAHPAPQTEPPAEPRRTGLRAMGWPLVAAGVGVGAALLLHFRDPHGEGSYGICPVYALTGLYCPGCGGMRGMNNLTDGRILDAIHSNLLVLPLVLAFVLWIGDWSIRAWRGERMRLPRLSRTTMWVFFALLIGYSVLRNTPWGTWLTPV
ncbi:DUF2752 domain-containing protein [Nocardia anaemiae]|uniref:DUF2752 domain-containing protein n=1 Tax=Nocardia anaemiae TaxID=263910 RepID=UPI001FDEE83F|nr:DUF2752 domain-containing protein [Nocardia anaemiae]